MAHKPAPVGAKRTRSDATDAEPMRQIHDDVQRLVRSLFRCTEGRSRDEAKRLKRQLREKTMGMEAALRDLQATREELREALRRAEEAEHFRLATLPYFRRIGEAFLATADGIPPPPPLQQIPQAHPEDEAEASGEADAEGGDEASGKAEDEASGDAEDEASNEAEASGDAEAEANGEAEASGDAEDEASGDEAEGGQEAQTNEFVRLSEDHIRALIASM
jgi:hypothetical protein